MSVGVLDSLFDQSPGALVADASWRALFCCCFFGFGVGELIARDSCVTGNPLDCDDVRAASDDRSQVLSVVAHTFQRST